MADNTIETPLSSGATDQPNAPQTQQPQPDLQNIGQNAAGQKIGYDPAQGAWVDVVTRKPYVPAQPAQASTALPQQTIGAQDMIRNPQTGQTLVLDHSQNAWVDVATRKPYTPPEPSTLGKFANGVEQLHNDVTTGIGQGALDTVHGTGELIRKGLNAVPFVDHLGNKVIPPQGQAALDNLTTPQNAAQKAGYTAENIVEFLLGDEALKGLSLADKMPKVAKAADVILKNPILKNQILQKMVATGARTGATGALQTFVHTGGDPGKAAEVGATTGALGAAGEAAAGITHYFLPDLGRVVPAGEDTGAVSKQIAKVVKKSGLPAGERGINTLGESLSKDLGVDLKTPIEIQPEVAIRGGMADTFHSAAADAQTELSEGVAARDVASDFASKLKARASAGYQALDAASGGEWQRFERSIDNLRAKADELAGIDDEKAGAYSQQADTIENNRDALVKKLINDGAIDANTASQAVKDWAQQSSLARVAKVIKSNIRPASASQPEIVTNPSALEKGLQRLYDDPHQHLQRAMGSQDAADRLLNGVRSGNDTLKAMEEFKAIPPTGQRALGDIVKPHVSTKKIDWSGVQDDFENLNAGQRDAMFGEATPKVRQFINSRVTRQAMWKTAKQAAGFGAPTVVGGELLYHWLFDNHRQ